MKGLFRKAKAGYYLPFLTPSLLESPCVSGCAGLPGPSRLEFLLPLLPGGHPPAPWWALLCSPTISHLEIDVADFCQIPCLNGGRCIGRDECWCPTNSTGKFCHLPSPKLDTGPPERGSRHGALWEGPLRQSTFTLPLSNQLGECGAGGYTGSRAWGCWHCGEGTEAASIQTSLLLCPRGSISFPKLLFALPPNSSIFFFCPCPQWVL